MCFPKKKKDFCISKCIGWLFDLKKINLQIFWWLKNSKFFNECWVFLIFTGKYSPIYSWHGQCKLLKLRLISSVLKICLPVYLWVFNSPYVWLWFSTTKKTLGQWEGASFQRWTHKVNILELWTVGKTLKVCFVKVFSCFANIWQFFLYGTLHATGTDSMCLKIQLKSTIPYMTKSYTIQWTQYKTIK